jgi:hypothetical protein
LEQTTFDVCTFYLNGNCTNPVDNSNGLAKCRRHNRICIHISYDEIPENPSVNRCKFFIDDPYTPCKNGVDLWKCYETCKCERTLYGLCNNKDKCNRKHDIFQRFRNTINKLQDCESFINRKYCDPKKCWYNHPNECPEGLNCAHLSLMPLCKKVHQNPNQFCPPCNGRDTSVNHVTKVKSELKSEWKPAIVVLNEEPKRNKKKISEETDEDWTIYQSNQDDDWTANFDSQQSNKILITNQPVETRRSEHQVKIDNIISQFNSSVEAQRSTFTIEIDKINQLNGEKFYEKENLLLLKAIGKCNSRLSSMSELDLTKKDRAAKRERFQEVLENLKSQLDDLNFKKKKDNCEDMIRCKLDNLVSDREHFEEKVSKFRLELLNKVTNLELMNKNLLEKQSLIDSPDKKLLKKLNLTARAFKDTYQEDKNIYDNSLAELITFVKEYKLSTCDNDSDDDSDDGIGFF